MNASTKSRTSVAKFEEFFATTYKDDVFEILEKYPDERSLTVDYNDLEMFDPDLADLLIEKPEEVIEASKSAIKNIDPLVKDADINIRFENLSNIIPLKTLLSKYIGTFVAADGIVRKTDEIRPRIETGVFECRGCMRLHDETALKMNRCHTFADFLKGYEMLRKRNVNVCAHIIDGLPGEDRDMMLETAKTLGQLDIQSIKIHLLHVLKGTVLAQMYERGEFRALDMDEYVNIVCDQLELLPAEIVIQRVTGDGAKDDLVAPLWSLKKFCVMNEIDKEMGRRNSWQGKALSE